MRITQAIATFFIGVIFGAIYACTVNAHSQTPEPTPKTEIQYVYIESEPEVITETVYVPYEEPFYRNLTEEDRTALDNMNTHDQHMDIWSYKRQQMY